jgi:tRNA(Met) C34 N-acetyltransferase TmcA
MAAYVDDGVAAYVDNDMAAYMDDEMASYVGIDFFLLSHLLMSRFWKKNNFWSKIISTNKNLNL